MIVRNPTAHEPVSEEWRTRADAVEPKSLRTFTPSRAVIALSSGSFHWTVEGRRLYDFTSGVLVANLGHHPKEWTRRLHHYLQSPAPAEQNTIVDQDHVPEGYYLGVPLTAYNAYTPIEVEATERLLTMLRTTPFGARFERIVWAASGSEAIQKALWAAMNRQNKHRPIVLATRHGFHGKKGLAGAVSGSELDSERDSRVVFIDFPMAEVVDLSLRGEAFDTAPFEESLDHAWGKYGTRIGTLITEPYLGGGGSYHPHPRYLQMLENFCREKDVVFILDEVQANFGRTGERFAFEKYGVAPDMVVLGKGLGNGVPVAAVAGPSELFSPMNYGETSDTWSANPLSCAAVAATLDDFESGVWNAHLAESSAIIEAGLIVMKELPIVAHVRGEQGGMVWGVETRDHDGRSAAEWANRFVAAAYEGDGQSTDGVHLLGPLAKKVVRISPPLTIRPEEARDAMALLRRSLDRLALS